MNVCPTAPVAPRMATGQRWPSGGESTAVICVDRSKQQRYSWNETLMNAGEQCRLRHVIFPIGRNQDDGAFRT
jgi:hypothetical protein